MTDTAPAAATGLPSLDRRSLLGSAALASIVAATAAMPAAAGEPNPDAALLALHSRWLAARAASADEQPPPSPEYAAALASLPSFRGVTDHDEISRIVRARCEVLDEIEARLGQPPAPSPEAQMRQDKAFADECEMIGAITATPARSLSGLAIKAEVSAIEEHLDPALIASIMADIASLASAA